MLAKNLIKQNYRNQCISNLKSLPDSEKSLNSGIIFSKLQNFLSSFSGFWAAFQPLSTEPQIEFKKISNIQWCFPKMNGSTLDFYSGVTEFKKSTFQVLEPVDGSAVGIQSLTGICVPALAFHTEGYRLGRGKGFYDQAFQNFEGVKIGLGFDFCVSHAVPYESHDLKMNYIITNKLVHHLTDQFKQEN